MSNFLSDFCERCVLVVFLEQSSRLNFLYQFLLQITVTNSTPVCNRIEKTLQYDQSV